MRRFPYTLTDLIPLYDPKGHHDSKSTPITISPNDRTNTQKEIFMSLLGRRNLSTTFVPPLNRSILLLSLSLVP